MSDQPKNSVKNYRLAGKRISVETIHGEYANSPSNEIRIHIETADDHSKFLREQVMRRLEEQDFNISRRYENDGKTLVFRHKSGGTSIGMNVASETDIENALKTVAKTYPDASLIDLAMRSNKARDTHQVETHQFKMKNEAARNLLGDAEGLKAFLAQSLENGGHEICIGGRVNFDLDSTAGKKFLTDLAETLLARTAERLPTTAAHEINGRRISSISGS